MKAKNRRARKVTNFCNSWHICWHVQILNNCDMQTGAFFIVFYSIFNYYYKWINEIILENKVIDLPTRVSSHKNFKAIFGFWCSNVWFLYICSNIQNVHHTSNRVEKAKADKLEWNCSIFVLYCNRNVFFCVSCVCVVCVGDLNLLCVSCLFACQIIFIRGGTLFLLSESPACYNKDL